MLFAGISDVFSPHLVMRFPCPVIASQKRGSLVDGVFLEVAELVPSVTEEPRSEFASATPRDRCAPRKDSEEAYATT